MTRKPHPTDLTDTQREALAPLLPGPKSGTRKGGRPAADTREVVNALAYLLRSGTAWRLLPHDFPAWQTVYTRFRLWRLAGVREAVHDRLREEVRIDAGAPPTPQTLRVDSQTVKTAHGGPKGYDGGKKGERPEAVRRGRLARADPGAAGHHGGRPGPGRRVLAVGRGPGAAGPGP